MRFLLVDDEPFVLKDLEEALHEAAPDGKIASFIKPGEALEYAKENAVDTAFLDIELGSMNGLVLAKKLKDILPEVHIIFVTSHERYAVGAFRLRATGYVMKPATAEDIRLELTFLYGENTCHHKIRVQTFGGFDVFVNGKPLSFGRSKAKELLAYLIDKKGSTVTGAEACAALWEGDSDDVKNKEYLRVLIKELRKTLKNAAIETVLIRSFNSIAIRPELLDCDSYRFFDGDAEAVNQYKHNYMPGYSWAEFTLGEMECRFYRMIKR